MAITVTSISTNLLYRVTITGVDGAVELLRWTLATGALTSDVLPASVLSMLQARWVKLVQGVEAPADQAALLGYLLTVRDGRGDLTVQAQQHDTHNLLAVTGLSAGTTYQVFISIPHSMGSFLA